MTGSLDASVIATVMAKEEGVPYVTAKARDEVPERIAYSLIEPDLRKKYCLNVMAVRKKAS